MPASSSFDVTRSGLRAGYHRPRFGCRRHREKFGRSSEAPRTPDDRGVRQTSEWRTMCRACARGTPARSATVFARNRRTIDGREQKPFRIGRSARQTGLQRAQLSPVRIRIDRDPRIQAARMASAWCASTTITGSQNSANTRDQPSANVSPRYSSSALGRPIRLRGSRGENHSRDHFNSARRLSCAKIDFESERQSASGARRTAIISATTEIAISSGDSAPISRPIGAKIFSKRRTREAFFFELVNHRNGLALASDHGDVLRLSAHRPAQHAHVVAMPARDDDACSSTT